MHSAEGSFARRQLEKHGWSDGAGLGAREHGITHAIKVKIKKDTTGVGHDPGKEFTHHWWDEAFNKAASKITVEFEEDEVVVKTCAKSSDKLQENAAKKRAFYNNFIKSSLLSGGLEQDIPKVKSVDSDDDQEEKAKTPQTLLLPEDVLFQKCGGRTAHKAARHGLKLNGKLKRIEEHERILFEKYSQLNKGLIKKNMDINNSTKPVLPSDPDNSIIQDDLLEGQCIDENFRTKTREMEDHGEKKKKRKKIKRELSICVQNTEEERKGTICCEEDIGIICNITQDKNAECDGQKKKKKKTSNSDNVDTAQERHLQCDDRKRVKKKKTSKPDKVDTAQEQIPECNHYKKIKKTTSDSDGVNCALDFQNNVDVPSLVLEKEKKCRKFKFNVEQQEGNCESEKVEDAQEYERKQSKKLKKRRKEKKSKH